MKRIISTVLVCVLLVGCVFTLFSCGNPNTDPSAAKAALEEEGYTVTFRENVGGYKATIFADKNDIANKKYEYIEIYYFADNEASQKAWDLRAESYLKQAEESKGTDYEIEVGHVENLIYRGTVKAVKAAK